MFFSSLAILILGVAENELFLPIAFVLSGIIVQGILLRRFSLVVRPKEWPAPGSEDTKFGVTMGPEVGHAEAEVYAGVQA
jgi:hypothetical protein